MKNKTNAIRIHESKKIDYITHDYSDSDAVSGLEVAEYLNQDPNKLYKTLVTVSKSNKNYVFLVPVSKELDLKKAAECVNEKNIEMIKSKDLLALTGYIHGGCSPIGMKKQFKTVIDSSLNNLEKIICSAGVIGLQIELKKEDLQKVIPYELHDITK
ncbi:MAG: Cys-tRNA(Pro) deacylase [Bacilli bacterium]|nr:Cys-tRNA(Pro) deacylase [Bacilli bacterium]